MTFKETLESKGAREFQIVALSLDETRALAAIAEAERRGIEHVIPYALTLYDDPSWRPTGAKSRLVTNAVVEVRCDACDGDRFVLAAPYDPMKPYDETYAPCAKCNAGANTTRWLHGDKLRTAPR